MKRPSLDEINSVVYTNFLAPVEHNILIALQSSVSNNCSADGPEAALFKSLSNIINSCCLPFYLARTSVISLLFDRIFSAERIRRLPVKPGDPKDLNDQEARRSAEREMSSRMEDAKEQLRVTQEVGLHLYKEYCNPEVKAAAEALLIQSLSSIWTSFEVFSSDFSKEICNENPNRALELFTSDRTKKYFDQKNLMSLENLEENGFNFSCIMGDVIFSHRKLDSFAVLSSAIQVLLGQDPNVAKQLKHPDLWLLNQRRHLIVHRMGRVDKQYLSATSDEYTLGDQLRVSTRDIRAALQIVRDTALAMISARSAL